MRKRQNLRNFTIHDKALFFINKKDLKSTYGHNYNFKILKSTEWEKIPPRKYKV